MARRASLALIPTRRKRRTAPQTGTDAARKASATSVRSALRDRSVQKNLSARRSHNAMREHRPQPLHHKMQREARKNLSARSVESAARERSAETATADTTTATATTGTAERKNRTEAMKLKGIILGALLLMMVAGCTRPVYKSSYVSLNRLTGWADDTPLKLTFEMTDTLGESELYLVGEIATKRTVEEKVGYPIKLTFIAPDSTCYTDSITLPLHVIQDGKIARTSHGIKEIEWPYRKNIYNKIPGMWEVTISKADTLDDYSNIIGLGIRCKQLSYER